MKTQIHANKITMTPIEPISFRRRAGIRRGGLEGSFTRVSE
ncbi:hypothetical protein CC_1373 [Caulobacter vibrioides CB15]|uniref:Uncharacterized protein n=1 Tax=Caulobacter vibrioides (strain ATCC 19089 / CIP 103742 / CB 15) TaxID=190650 RepID=Q9A8I0_CAUVC|nr:hypothetical protein CC_1373 [Caulobacter vibrioides CB15]